MIASYKLLSIIGVAVALAGCSSTVPKGMTEQDAKDAIERMTPEQKIKFYNSSPMSQAEKEAKFKEIEEKTGVKASDVLKDQPTIPGGH